jgi:hypothetical protein
VGQSGITPITNAWYLNGTLLNDGTLSSGAIVSGSKTAALTIANVQANDAGTYTFYATNLYGTSSTAGTVVVDPEPEFRDQAISAINVSGTPFGTSSFTPVVTNGAVQLTSVSSANSGINANSYWFKQKAYVGAFQVHFVFTDVEDSAGGVAFVLQNSAAGTAACGDCGAALGVADWEPYTGDAITKSFEFDIENWNNAISINTNGVAPPEAPAPSFSGTGEDYIDGPTGDTNASPEYAPGDFPGHPGGSFDFWLKYDGTTFSMVYSNETTGVTDSSFSTNVGPEFIQSAVGGSTAYMGFTAGTVVGDIDRVAGLGYLYEGDTFTISSFSYTPMIALSVTKTNGGGAVLSWPSGVGGYSLQGTTNLASTNWTTVPVNYTTNSSGNYQYVVQPGSGNEYYRLVLP